jgi:hypothetical protein
MAEAGTVRRGEGTAAERKRTMRAQVGDLLIADGAESHRVCEIIRLNHADGSPPYVVRWLSDGHIALMYPGRYARLVPQAGGKGHHDRR